MVALQITEIGTFMNSMLKDGLFDHFLLQEASVNREITYTIDGTVTPGYYDEEELSEAGLSGVKYIPFGRIRAHCFELMRGKKKPVSFKFVLRLSPDNQRRTLEKTGSSFRPGDIGAMFLNLTYKNGALVCTTGISYKLFSTDKTLEREWDRLVTVFFRQHGIPFEMPD